MDECESLLDRMEADGVAPNLRTYNTLLRGDVHWARACVHVRTGATAHRMRAKWRRQVPAKARQAHGDSWAGARRHQPGVQRKDVLRGHASGPSCEGVWGLQRLNV